MNCKKSLVSDDEHDDFEEQSFLHAINHVIEEGLLVSSFRYDSFAPVSTERKRWFNI